MFTLNVKNLSNLCLVQPELAMIFTSGQMQRKLMAKHFTSILQQIAFEIDWLRTFTSKLASVWTKQFWLQKNFRLIIRRSKNGVPAKALLRLMKNYLKN